jgi:hypothetical protein
LELSEYVPLAMFLDRDAALDSDGLRWPRPGQLDPDPRSGNAGGVTA